MLHTWQRVAASRFPPVFHVSPRRGQNVITPLSIFKNEIIGERACQSRRHTRHIAPAMYRNSSDHLVECRVLWCMPRYIWYRLEFKFIPILTPWYERIERHEKDLIRLPNNSKSWKYFSHFCKVSIKDSSLVLFTWKSSPDLGPLVHSETSFQRETLRLSTNHLYLLVVLLQQLSINLICALYLRIGVYRYLFFRRKILHEYFRKRYI